MSNPMAPPEPAPSPAGSLWHVVIPVKDTQHGKSRLARATGPDRAALSRAIAEDTIAAAVDALGAGGVTLVTSDAGLAADAAGLGVDVVDDPGEGLNPAIEAGLRRVPSASRPAAMLGDLPCLTVGELLAALAEAGQHAQSFVPDAEGVGTVLRCGTAASGLVPRFGGPSAATHQADGAHRLELDLPRLRTDVDDPVSLAVAARLGLGDRTRAVVEQRWSGWIASMQASVHTFDPDTRTGSVLRDDGVEVLFTAQAFDASGLRLVRVGQRLTVEVAGDAVVSLGIVGIGAGQPIR